MHGPRVAKAQPWAGISERFQRYYREFNERFQRYFRQFNKALGRGKAEAETAP